MDCHALKLARPGTTIENNYLYSLIYKRRFI